LARGRRDASFVAAVLRTAARPQVPRLQVTRGTPVDAARGFGL